MIETRNPRELRPHAAIQAMPRWGEESAEWAGFVADIRQNGIRHPLQVTEDGQVVDGETRRRAACEIGLEEVPVQLVPADEVATVILRELALERHLTKGQLAYLAVPLLAQAFEEREARRLANLKKGENANDSPNLTESTSGSLTDLAAGMGISYDTLNQARNLRIWLEQQPQDVQERNLDRLFDPVNPAGLGALLRGAGFLDSKAARDGEHTGNRPKDPTDRFRLFASMLKVEATRFRYWQEAEDDTRRDFFRQVSQHAASLPADVCADRAEYHAKVAAAFRSRAKEEVCA